jgi:hypothetical protein
MRGHVSIWRYIRAPDPKELSRVRPPGQNKLYDTQAIVRYRVIIMVVKTAEFYRFIINNFNKFLTIYVELYNI